MATERIYEESAFQQVEPVEAFETPRMSKLAVISLLLGLLGLVALLAPSMMVVSGLALVLGVLAFVLQMLGPGSDQLGKNFAILGAGLGALATIWSYTALSKKNEYLFNQGAVHAERFMQVLAEGRVYEAMELTQMEPDRQITGTNLEKYYTSLEEEAGEPFREFSTGPLATRILQSGPNAKWRCEAGTRVTRSGNATEVVLEMKNEADPDGEPIYVRLQRSLGVVLGEEGKNTALWHVIDLQTAERVALGP